MVRFQVSEAISEMLRPSPAGSQRLREGLLSSDQRFDSTIHAMASFPQWKIPTSPVPNPLAPQGQRVTSGHRVEVPTHTVRCLPT